jgi:AcrR family transcriptional regulator
MKKRYLHGRTRLPSKRMRTRARLTEAALKVMSERGISAASVSEIAEVADVANGTFYLHFQNKSEIVSAVCNSVTRAIHEEMSGDLYEIEDGAARVAFATQQFIEIAADELEWGRLLISAFAEFEDIKGDISRYMRADIAAGVAQGRFQKEVDEFSVDCLLALLRTGISARLSGSGPEIGIRCGEYMLRVLGMSFEDIRKVIAAVGRQIQKVDLASKA